VKKQWFIIFSVSLLVALSSLACVVSAWPGTVRGSGRVVEREIDVAGFTGVALTNQGDLTIEYGEEEELIVEAEDNLIDYLEFRVVNGTLRIDTQPGVSLYPTRPIKFYLTVTELDAVEVTGSGNVEGPVLEGDGVSVTVTGSGDALLDGLRARREVELRVTGSGDVEITGGAVDGASVEAGRVSVTVNGSGDVRLDDVEAEQIDVRLTGSGDLTVSGGAVEEQDIHVTGSGVYTAQDLESETVDTRVSGAGNVTVWVREALDAEVTGSGDVYYIGAPALRERVTGAGDVRRIDR